MNPDVTQWVLHVDLDEFIAAVEMLRRPGLRGRPVVVGGDGDPAKRGGWDEAFLGVTTGDPEGFARGIAARVRAATGLDCSVGIGENKLQAKIATGFGKPAGVFRLTAANWFGVLGDSTPEVIWGIGAKTAARLAGLGITTVRELAAADPARLAAEFGPAAGPWLVLLGRGRGDTEVSPAPHVPHSHGREVTFQRDLTDWSAVAAQVARLARQVAAEVAGRPVARVVVKIRYAPFVTVTHGVPLPRAGQPPGVLPPGVPLAVAIERAAAAALARFTADRPVRLAGVRAEFAGPDRDRRHRGRLYRVR